MLVCGGILVVPYLSVVVWVCCGGEGWGGEGGGTACSPMVDGGEGVRGGWGGGVVEGVVRVGGRVVLLVDMPP